MAQNLEKLLAILGCSFWGLTFIFLKPASPFVPASDLVFWRFLFTGLFLIAFQSIAIRKFNFNFSLKEFKLLIISSFLGFFLYQLFCNFGVSLITGSEAGLIHGLIPVITVCLERIVRKKKITPLKHIALLISILGIYLISKSSAGASNQYFGYLLMFGGISCWVFYTFISEQLLSKFGGIELLAYQSVLGCIWVIPYNLLFEQRVLSFGLFETPTAWVNILLSAILSSGIGYILYMRGVKNLGIGNMSFIVNIMPVASLLAGFLILGDPITIYNIFGLVFILFSVYLILVDASTSTQVKKGKKKFSFSR